MRLSELKILREESLETKMAEELWGENSDSATEYVSTSEYHVRPIKDTKPVKYEVFAIVADKSKPFGEFDAAGLVKTLKPIRPNQTPDAEGFTTYTDPQKVEAFQYAGDPCKLTLDNKETVQLSKGMYVIRSVKGSSFAYSVEDESTFESTLKKA